jgi:putative ABC transport system permease protein
VKVRGHDADYMGILPGGMIQPGVSQGRWLSAADQRAGAAVAVMGVNVTRVSGIQLGDLVRVDTGAGPVALEVVGLSTAPAAIDHVYLPLRTAQTQLRVGSTADGFLVQTRSTSHAAIDRTTIRLEDRLAAHGYPVSGSERYLDEQRNVASNAQVTNAITALGFLIVGISMIGLVNTMTANVLERTREIGVLRCIGARRRDLRRIFESEGLAVALIGWLVGIPVGYVIFRLMLRATSSVMNLDLVATFPARNVAIALAGTIVLAAVVMAMPLRRAIRLRPGDALRYQ